MLPSTGQATYKEWYINWDELQASTYVIILKSEFAVSVTLAYQQCGCRVLDSKK